MKQVRALCCSCWFVTACSAAPLPPSPASPVAAATPTVAPAPAAHEAPPATTSAPERSPFYVIGELPVAYLTLHSAGDRGFLMSQQGIELQLIGDEVVQDPLLKRGLPGIEAMYSVNAIAGRWPDAAWLSTSHPYERTGFSTLWNWDGKSWKKKLSTNPGLFIETIQPWVGGRLLALEQSGMWFEASFRVLSGDTRVALPQFVKTKNNDDFVFCQTEMRVEAFATLPNGEVFAAGQSCDVEGNIEVSVKRWAAGDKRGKLEILPGTRAPADPQQSEWHITGIAAQSPTSVFVSASKVTWRQETRERHEAPYFAHFDGKSWQALPPPIAGGVQALWSQTDGVLYGSDTQGGLWSGSASTPRAAWSRVPFPAQIVHGSHELAKLGGFWLRGPGDAWALVKVGVDGKGERDYLLHTRPPANKLPTIEAFTRKDAELALPGPPVDWCTTPFVLLYTLGRNAPAAYDYPATRAALKGHQEFAEDISFIEFSREGRRYFGARVPDFKVGKQLASLVKAKVPGATPQLVCHAPAETRTFAIDLKTGELSSPTKIP
jgi:hypothetical protein